MHFVIQNCIIIMNFEWDENKNKGNIVKHNIDFDLASCVFLDEYRIEYYDEMHSTNEDRYITIGLVNDILYVVYTMRNENIRIISARVANNEEKERYYDSKSKIG